MLVTQVLICNKLGLHARAAAKLVTTASAYQANVELEYNDRRVNGKSIMGVMMLAASNGSTLTLYVDGNDEEAATQSLKVLIENRFGESS